MKAELASPGTSGASAPRAYEAAMAADPGNFLPYLGYGQWLLSHGDPAQAAGWLKRALARRPAHGPARFHLGLAYMNAGLIEEAASELRQSGVLPETLGYWAWKHGEFMRKQAPEDRDWTVAERYLQTAVALRPDELAQWEWLAGFYRYTLRDHERALATWRAAARAMPGSPIPHRRAAELIWHHWHDASGALAELEEAVRLAPDEVEAYLMAAEILRQEGDVPAAEAWLRRATDAAPDSGEAHFRLGELYLALGRPPQAIQALRAATAVAPDVARYQARLGQALQAMGLLAEAIRAAEVAAALEPEEPAHHRLLGELYRQAGQQERALASYRRVLELAPDDARAQEALREMEGTAGDGQ